MSSYKIDIYHHLVVDAPPPDPRLDALMAQNARILAQLSTVVEKENQIMTNEETALAAIKTVKDATDAQGAVLATEATSLQTISDNLDKLIANSGASPSVLAGLQTMADSVAAVSANLQKQADFSTALASKGVSNPVPVPVPGPTPEPAPIP